MPTHTGTSLTRDWQTVPRDGNNAIFGTVIKVAKFASKLAAIPSGKRGRPWRDMPKEYPPYQTCHRRFQQWSWEYHAENYLGFVLLVCIKMLIKYL